MGSRLRSGYPLLRFLSQAWEEHRVRRALRALRRGDRSFRLSGQGPREQFRAFVSPFLAPPRPRTARILAAVLTCAMAAGIALSALLQDGSRRALPDPGLRPQAPLPGPGRAALVPPAPVPFPAAMPERFHALVACKRDRTLYAYLREPGGRWTKQAAFPMAFGRRRAGAEEDGPPAASGATPEGRYWITAMLPGSARGPRFGSLVYFLAPARATGQVDRSGVVWIHGVEAGRRPSFTRGHIALANDDAVALSDYAGPATPVVILPDSALPDPGRQLDPAVLAAEYPAVAAGSSLGARADSLRRAGTLAEARAFLSAEARAHPHLAEAGLPPADKGAILARLSRWREDVQRRDTGAVRAHYAPDFKDLTGRGLRDFLEKRSRQLAGRTRVVMDMETPEIAVEGYGRVSVTFRQRLRAEGGVGGIPATSAPKTLWLEQGPEGWFIVKE